MEWNDGVVLLFPDPWKCFCCCCGVAVVVPGPTHRRTTSGSEPGSTFRGKRAVGAGSRRTWPPRDLFPLDTSRGADVHRRRSSPNTSTFMTTQCFFWCNLVLGWFVCFGDFLSTEATDQTLADWRAPGGCVRQLTTDLVCTLILIENLDDRIKLKF